MIVVPTEAEIYEVHHTVVPRVYELFKSMPKEVRRRCEWVMDPGTWEAMCSPPPADIYITHYSRDDPPWTLPVIFNLPVVLEPGAELTLRERCFTRTPDGECTLPLGHASACWSSPPSRP